MASRFSLQFHCWKRFVLLRLNAIVIWNTERGGIENYDVKLLGLQLRPVLNSLIWNSPAKLEGIFCDDVCINCENEEWWLLLVKSTLIPTIVVNVVVAFVRSHYMIDIVELCCVVKSDSTLPKFRNLCSQNTSLRLHEINVVGQREKVAQAETNVTSDMLLGSSHILVARLNDFNSSCCAFPREPSQ